MINLLKDTKLEETQQRFLGVIDSSSQSLIQIINDILGFSKIEAGKMNIESTTIDLEQLIHDTMAIFSSRTEEKSLIFTQSMDKDVPVIVKTDPVRIKQMLLNYLSNAFKFTHKGAISLQVSVDRDKILPSSEDIQIRFTVRDTGIGLTQEQINNLFQQFRQANANTTRLYGGTGLGLSIIKKLSSLMAGDAGVESVEGEGSNFWFTIRAQTFKDLASKDLPANDAPSHPAPWYQQAILVCRNSILQGSIGSILSTLQVETTYTNNISKIDHPRKRTIIFIDFEGILKDRSTETNQAYTDLINSETPIVVMGYASTSIEKHESNKILFIEKPITNYLLRSVIGEPKKKDLI